MAHQYDGAICRTLNQTEKRVRTSEIATPLVIEPLASPTPGFLQELLTSHSSQLVEDISEHGALLLRGFNVETAESFERSILSIQNMRGMKDILFQLAGRKTPCQGTQFVFATSISSRLEKTGGTLKFDMFHTENYGFPDVPSYLAFFCITPSTAGGETGLINLGGLYSDVPNLLKNTLEARCCLVQLHSVPSAARKHNVRTLDFVRFCEEEDLPIVRLGGVDYVAIYKPNVIQHPVTGERTLLVNFNWIDGLHCRVINEFSSDYTGVRWFVHRLSWRHPWLHKAFLKSIESEIPGGDIYVGANSPISGARSLSSLFSPDDVFTLARSMRRRYSSFLWKKGDILLVDNLKIAHTGMPGHGRRRLQIMMCNPLRLPSKSASPGLHPISIGSTVRECLGTRLLHFRDRRSAFSGATA